MCCALDTNLIEIQLQNYVYQRSNCAKLIVLQDGCDSVKDLISTGGTMVQKNENIGAEKKTIWLNLSIIILFIGHRLNLLRWNAMNPLKIQFSNQAVSFSRNLWPLQLAIFLSFLHIPLSKSISSWLQNKKIERKRFYELIWKFFVLVFVSVNICWIKKLWRGISREEKNPSRLCDYGSMQRKLHMVSCQTKNFVYYEFLKSFCHV